MWSCVLLDWLPEFAGVSGSEQFVVCCEFVAWVLFWRFLMQFVGVLVITLVICFVFDCCFDFVNGLLLSLVYFLCCFDLMRVCYVVIFGLGLLEFVLWVAPDG